MPPPTQQDEGDTRIIIHKRRGQPTARAAARAALGMSAEGGKEPRKPDDDEVSNHLHVCCFVGLNVCTF